MRKQLSDGTLANKRDLKGTMTNEVKAIFIYSVPYYSRSYLRPLFIWSTYNVIYRPHDNYHLE